MSTITLEDRASALENEFFAKEDAKKLQALQLKEATAAQREDLRRSCGLSDDKVLDQLIALGLSASNIAALSLVPLVAVAWADGEIQANERDAILQGAAGKGLQKDSPGYVVLADWLAKKPSEQVLTAWEAYIKALLPQLNDGQIHLLKEQIVGFAKMVGESAGGILGFATTSKSEGSVIARIERAFAK